MKYLKIKVNKVVTGGSTEYFYPKWYDPKKVNVVMYETTFTKGKADSEQRGNADEFIHCMVDDDYGAQIIREDSVTELEREAFIADADANHEVTEKITDPEKVLKVLAKQARGEILDKVDTDTIDPTKEESGIIMSPSFREKVESVDGIKIKPIKK